MTAPYRIQDNRLSWDRVDQVADRDLKLILNEGDFVRLFGRVETDGRPHYYRGRDCDGNSIAVRVVPDAIAA